jgi:hypothetical protein
VVRVAYVAPVATMPVVRGTTRIDFQPQDEWPLWSLGFVTLLVPLLIAGTLSTRNQWGKAVELSFLLILAALMASIIFLTFRIIAWRVPTILARAVTS